MGFFDWLKKKFETKEGPAEIPPKPVPEERELVAKWVEEISTNLRLLREEFKEASVPVEEVRGPILKGINRLAEKLDGIKTNTDKIPEIQDSLKLLNELSNSLSDLKQLVKQIPKEPLKMEPKHLIPLKQEFEAKLETMEGIILPRRIEAILADGRPRSFKELKQILNTTDPTLAKYLKIMVDQGKLEREIVGRRTFYTIRKSIEKEIGEER